MMLRQGLRRAIATQGRALTTPVAAVNFNARTYFTQTQTNLFHTLFNIKANTSSVIHPISTSSRGMAEIASNAADVSNVPVTHMPNIAVIAHVDHGKTTLVDSILSSGGTRMVEGEVRLMDSNAIERERGITILAKCTSIIYSDQRTGDNYQINIVDTPGHADFGGEVERIMTMVDGVILIVDATDGPMTQTKFVLNKALQRGIKPIVVVNKVDRPSQRLGDVEDEVLELFFNLEASDDQLEYPTLYGSGRAKWLTDKPVTEPEFEGQNMSMLFDKIIDYIPHPAVDLDGPFKMLVTQIESDNFFGKCLIGRIVSGSCKPGDAVHALDENGAVIETTKVLKVIRRRGMNRFIVDEAFAGDIISLAGFSAASVNATLCHPSVTDVIPSIPIDPPTLSMSFHVNDSPLAGKSGSAVTANALKLRLLKEAENNVSIRVIEGKTEALEVRARGELQLGIILETLRREGIELAVSPPNVVFDYDSEAQQLLEPVEEVTIDIDENHAGSVIEKLAKRSAEMLEFIPMKDGRARLIFTIPTRGFLGYRSEFVNDTRGTGIINSIFHSYVPYSGEISRNEKGALLSMEDGVCTAYALEGCDSRGTLFVEPGDSVYRGMVVGENTRSDDIELNPVKSKQLTNIRAAGKDEKVRLSPPKKFTIEELISYVRDDEVIEITPDSVRLRKKILDANSRKTAAKSAKSVALKSLTSGAVDPRFLNSLTMK